ncbi:MULTISPECIES: hypothetical protein [Hahella]|nr:MULTISPECIES: hypothetical protein [Hahella]MBU6951924.1 hypothetical protein [Hahella sp. HN01]MDG9670814.1 hypothetical protein [Hahella sp. CR1]
MYRVNAFTQKGAKFRFRIQSESVADLHDILDRIFEGRKMRLVVVEPVV